MPDHETPGRDLTGLPLAEFAFPGLLRDQLVALVLAGTKTATASLVVDYVVDGSPLSQVGELQVVIDSADRPVGLIETTRVELSTIKLVTDEFARDEGEGYADAAAWRVSHERYWNGYLEELRAGLRDPSFVLTDSTPVVCEWFRLIERFQED